MAAEYIVAQRQPQGRPLRARHPHLRDDDPQHASTSTPSRCSSGSRTCRSSPTRRTARGARDGARRWRARRWRRARMACMVEVHPDPATALSDGAAVAHLRRVQGPHDRRARGGRGHRTVRRRPRGLTVRVRVRRAGRLEADVLAPGDKSISHRALLFGALGTTPLEVRNLAPGADVRSTRRVSPGAGRLDRRGRRNRDRPRGGAGRLPVSSGGARLRQQRDQHAAPARARRRRARRVHARRGRVAPEPADAPGARAAPRDGGADGGAGRSGRGARAAPGGAGANARRGCRTDCRSRARR